MGPIPGGQADDLEPDPVRSVLAPAVLVLEELGVGLGESDANHGTSLQGVASVNSLQDNELEANRTDSTGV